jgi:hypothetical protein
MTTLAELHKELRELTSAYMDVGVTIGAGGTPTEFRAAHGDALAKYKTFLDRLSDLHVNAEHLGC